MAVKSLSSKSAKPAKSSSSLSTKYNDQPIIQHFQKYQGQQIVVLCSRFTYWGVMSEVYGGSEPFMIMSQAVAVEQSGKCDSDRPEHFDPINGDLTVFLNSVEIMFQPRWSQGPLPGTEGNS